MGAGLYTLASPPYEWSLAAWVALTPLFLALRERTLPTAFATGLLYGVLFCGGIAPWVYFAIVAYFPLSAPVALLFTLLSYSVYVGLYTGLAAMCSCALMRSEHRWRKWFGVPAFWVCGEFARSTLFSGFSWELLGYTQYRNLALIQIADITGVYGVSFLLAFSGYATAELWSHVFSQHRRQARRGAEGWKLSTTSSPWPAFASLLVLVTLTLMYGRTRLNESWEAPALPPLQVALVHQNPPGITRWQRVHYASTLMKYIHATRLSVKEARADLVIWPEFAVGFYPERELALRRQLNLFMRELNAPLLLGAPRVERDETGERYYNSAYLFAPDGKLVEVYDKIRLVPFAEYRPLALPAFMPHSPESPSNFTAGAHPTIFTLPQSVFGVTICYEATYPSLSRRLTQAGAQFLVNVSNDTWLAGAAASAQHFSMAVFRAVENKRPLVRVATAGVSGFIDPLGRVSHLFHAREHGGVERIFPQHHVTFYTQYGDWFICCCAGFALLAVLTARFRIPTKQSFRFASSLVTNGLRWNER